MYGCPPSFPASLLTGIKSPAGALYTVQDRDDPNRHQFSHPLLTPITGASLLMSFSAYNATGVGMLSTVFSIITGAVGLWGLWTVRPIILTYVAVSDAGFYKIIFAGSGRRSKLGADKRTSTLIFGNKSAASEIKKNARKKQS